VVLDGLDLAVAPGRSLALLGRSGQGKSVTLKLALGLMKPDAGQVLLDGVDVTRQKRARAPRQLSRDRHAVSGRGAVRQFAGLGKCRLPPDQRRWRGAARGADRAVEALALVKLAPEVADRYPSELSGGMQKRAGLARAIVGTPSLLFFDEPTTGLIRSRRGRSTTDP
jgi:phospholipid/cholesterol/gamma-HCH transport system ATP-binding protein